MKIIGLTGSIGMGKSATAKMLRVMKIPVFDSDACVHHLLSQNPATMAEVAQAFPEAWDSVRQVIDRKKLGAIVFHKPIARKTLEFIIHPKVWKAQRDFIAKTRRAGQRWVVLDIPLLFETGSNRKCDSVFCVTAPSFIQQQRVLGRATMTPEKFKAILKGQMPDAHKRKLSDVVILTGLGRATTLQHLKKALRHLAKEKA
jgi:dephospho-CoA kinase